MAENTGIEWTDHTLNFWHGCVKVSPGCANCYAESASKRYGRDIFGPAKTTERWRTKGPWKEVIKWDKKAKADGVRRRLFCESMSDFFEDHPQLESWRAEAMSILENLEWLDVQLLTKRPENVARMAPQWMEHWPQHIWIGTSVEDQKTADKRIPELLKVPAKVRFLSCEPLLGPVDLRHVHFEDLLEIDALTGDCGVFRPLSQHIDAKVHWVIAGGESGPDARPLNPTWAKSLRDQCVATGTAFFFKQHGEYIARKQLTAAELANVPNAAYVNALPIEGDQGYRVGKKAAGRLLDGREWSQFPTTNYERS